ncbi:unnamed protein product, partial [Ixodes hexagonus]
DLKVDLTGGAVRGLDVVTRRLRSCHLPIKLWTFSRMYCHLDMSGLEVKYTVQTTGGELDLPTPKNISVSVVVSRATATVGVTLYEDSNAILSSFTLTPIMLHASSESYIDLSHGRSRAFLREVERYTRTELTRILQGSYLTALEQ